MTTSQHLARRPGRSRFRRAQPQVSRRRPRPDPPPAARRRHLPVHRRRRRPRPRHRPRPGLRPPPAHPRHHQGPAKVTSGTLHRARLDAGGTRLRLRALHVMGHGSARIARALGVREMTIRAIVRGDAATVSPKLRDAVTDLYDAWWDKRAPERTRSERGAATAARRRAIAGNWCAGAGLDDDELDTPGYRPSKQLETRHRHRHRPRHPPARTTPEDQARMTLRINDDSISSDHTTHTARLAARRRARLGSVLAARPASWTATPPSPRWCSPTWSAPATCDRAPAVAALSKAGPPNSA